jgi:c-di-GMP-binding flagellar brake protein YcgR
MRERRRHVRVETPLRAAFPHPETLKTERSITHDASDTGLRLRSAVGLQVGQRIALTLSLPFTDAPVQATGDVVWVRQSSQPGGRYDVGLRFQWLEDAARRRLARHLAEVLPSRV